MKRESHTVEWKSAWQDEYFKWVCAFANTDGGQLVIGRNDRGEVLGVANAKKLLEDIPNKARDLLGIVVDVRLELEDGKDLLAIHTAPYPYPISYRGKYNIRSGSTTQELKGAALDRFLLNKQGRHWDGVPVPNVAMGELSEAAINWFHTAASLSSRLDAPLAKETSAGLMERLNLLDGSHLKRAAVLLFHSHPERIVTGAFVKIGFFQSNANLRFHDVVQGNLFEQALATLDLLTTKYLMFPLDYEGLQRVETGPVPIPALREAILNALVHKDYASGAPVQISVYHDKLLIWNPGQLPANWTIGKLLEKHPSRPFNPDIANTFFRAGMIEAWGRGIERILEACRERKMPDPEFRQEADGLWVEFRFEASVSEMLAKDFGLPSPEAGSTTPKASSTTPETGSTTPETSSTTPETSSTTPETGSTTPETGSTTPEKILAAIGRDPSISATELAEALGLTRDGIRYHLRKLRANGVIEHVGPQKAGHWKILKPE